MPERRGSMAVRQLIPHQAECSSSSITTKMAPGAALHDQPIYSLVNNARWRPS